MLIVSPTRRTLLPQLHHQKSEPVYALMYLYDRDPRLRSNIGRIQIWRYTLDSLPFPIDHDSKMAGVVSAGAVLSCTFSVIASTALAVEASGEYYGANR
jgi:hypothetical protein